MPYYRICPQCHAYLNFGERCDCQDKEEAAPVLEHRDGPKVEIGLPTNISTPIVQQNKGGFQV